MNQLATTQQPQNDFSRALAHPGGNVGAIAIESERAIAEAQGQLIMAKRFPRSMAAAALEFLDSCKSPEFADVAFYSVPNRGSGPSIRFAEEAARCYGNFEYGHRELSRSGSSSEIEVYAWDKEKNNRSIRQITVAHVLDTKNGSRKLTDQADIDNKIANVASKQMRGRIMALMPKHMVAAGIAECKKTLAGGNDKPLRDRILAMSAAFSKFGVNSAMMEKHLGHPVDNTTIDEFADLMGIYNAIKEGGKASEFFPSDKVEDGENPTAKAITDAAKRPAAAATPAAATPAATKPKAAAKPVKEAEPVEAKKEAAPAAEPVPEPDLDAANAAANEAAQDDDSVF